MSQIDCTVKNRFSLLENSIVLVKWQEVFLAITQKIQYNLFNDFLEVFYDN